MVIVVLLTTAMADPLAFESLKTKAIAGLAEPHAPE